MSEIWNAVLKNIPGLVVGFILNYLVKPFMNLICPQTRLARRLAMTLNGEAQLFVTMNTINLPLLAFSNFLPFVITLTHIEVEILLAGVVVGTTSANQAPLKLKRGGDVNCLLAPVQITVLGQQQIAAVRSHNHGTDFLGTTVSVKIIARPFYDEIAVSRNLGMAIHVMN